MKFKRFKLNALSAEGLRQKEMDAIVGGNTCRCGCAYSENGGSPAHDNANANYGYGYQSYNSCNIVVIVNGEWDVVSRPKA